MKNKWWTEGLTDVCAHFQVDLSCLVDGELDEGASSRAIAHLEGCPDCREFFEDTRMQVKAHLDMADPDRLMKRFAALTGVEIAEQAEAFGLVERLATIFYQIGKAYVLTAIDPDFRTRVFEPAVKVESTRTHGRGFIDGVVASGRGDAGGVDWSTARHLLNGRLSKIEDALEKGKRLLQEALAIEPDHEESLLYMAYVHAHEGRSLRAAKEFRQIFDTAVELSNRGHAAIQLGRLYAHEGEFRQALVFVRWVTLSGLPDTDERFHVAAFNTGVYYAHMRDQRRALAAFRSMLDRHPARVGELAELFARSPSLRMVIDSQDGFTESLFRTCPELFQLPDVGGSTQEKP